jgi:hypothetical protein
MLGGVGIAYLFEHVVGAAIAAGTAIPLLEDWSPPFPGLYLYYPSRHTAPPLRAFIELLRQQSLAPEANQTFRDLWKRGHVTRPNGGPPPSWILPPSSDASD